MFTKGRNKISFGRPIRFSWSLVTAAMLVLAIPATASAAILDPWGSNLQATPTLDTANGASSQANDEPAACKYSSVSPHHCVYSATDPAAPTLDEAIATGTNGSCSYNWGLDTFNTCMPWYHSGADNTEWNTQLASGDSPTAPQDGQVLQIKVKGCAVKDTTAPTNSDGSQSYQGIPVNEINFQTLTPQGDGSYKGDATAPYFQLPFCSSSSDPSTGQVSTHSVTTYNPVHLCISKGDTVDFYDLGGFIPNSGSGASWYPQGVPFMVMAPVTGSSMDSYTSADVPNHSSPPIYAPGAQPTGNNSGWGQEPNQEVMLQAIEGTADDAYGQCPGGDAVEPSNSNQVICVTRHTNPGDPYGTCNAQDQPIFAPVNQSPPTVAATVNGKAVTTIVPGTRLDETNGSWTNKPYGYSYQWEDCDSSGANCTAIAGSAAKQGYYYVTTSDVGHTIEVQESATNTANTEGPVSSAPTAVVSSPNVPVITGLKLNPGVWNEASSSVLTYKDSEAATSTIKIVLVKTGAVVKTLTNQDRAQQFGGNGVVLKGLPAGQYRLEITANNLGVPGQTVTLSFTITSATPVITHLAVNPSAFNSAKGATITYIDSVPGSATLKVVSCSKTKKGLCTGSVAKTLHHRDRAGANGVKLTGVPPGRYQVQVTVSYSRYRSTVATASLRSKLVHALRHVALAAAFSIL